MPIRAGSQIPTYRKHKPTGQAVVTIGSQDFYLGEHGSATSRAEYNRRIAEWLAAGRTLRVNPLLITVGEVALAYRKHAQTYYRRADGSKTSEASRITRELTPLTKLYARTPAAELGPLRIKAARDSMIAAGWVRTSVNHAVGTIKRCFRWASENELVPASVFHGIAAIAGLRAGRSEAPEPVPVKPVPIEHVQAIQPYVSRQVWAMIQLQLVTGMRSGEVVTMRGVDIDTTGKVWIYRPAQHKSKHHGHDRAVYLGARGQELIGPFLKPNTLAYLFDPREAERERLAGLHARRKTPLSCGNVPGSNRVRKPKRSPKERYTTVSYARAVMRGCDKASPPPSELKDAELKAWCKDHRWHPHQLRHTAATELRKNHGLEAAQVVLGHRSLAASQLYAEKSADLAMRIASQVG